MAQIVGAGLSGLIAATQFPQAQVFEANGPEAVQHKAVLRFRSDKLSRLIGIPFRKVTVRKSIYSAGRHKAPSIALANLYSRKTNGGYRDRSIWNLDTVERYIAPEDLTEQMAEQIGNRIHWNTGITPFDLGEEPTISTMPMPQLIKMLRVKDHIMELPDDDDFHFASITVDRFRIRDADVYQTVYYPDHDTSVYRASMTGSLLIVERMQNWKQLNVTGLNDRAEQYVQIAEREDNLDMVMRSFGLLNTDIEKIELGHTQRFGKISPVNDEMRRKFIYASTVRHHVYALGRFATWRNILLDDVVDDVAIIKRLISQGHYGATLQHHKGNKES
jgi:hypothetical protein